MPEGLILPPSDAPEEDHGYSLPGEVKKEEDEEAPAWTTCFVVAIDQNGLAHASSNVEEFLADKTFQRKASANDMWLGTTQVQRDVEHASIAQRVMMNMHMTAAAIQEEMVKQQEAQQILASLDPGNRAARRARR